MKLPFDVTRNGAYDFALHDKVDSILYSVSIVREGIEEAPILNAKDKVMLEKIPEPIKPDITPERLRVLSQQLTKEARDLLKHGTSYGELKERYDLVIYRERVHIKGYPAISFEFSSERLSRIIAPASILLADFVGKDLWNLDKRRFNISMPFREPIVSLQEESTGFVYHVHTDESSVLNANFSVEAWFAQ